MGLCNREIVGEDKKVMHQAAKVTLADPTPMSVVRANAGARSTTQDEGQR